MSTVKGFHARQTQFVSFCNEGTAHNTCTCSESLHCQKEVARALGVCECVYVSLNLCVYAFVCVHVFARVCMCKCMYVRVCACVCVWAEAKQKPTSRQLDVGNKAYSPSRRPALLSVACSLSNSLLYCEQRRRKEGGMVGVSKSERMSRDQKVVKRGQVQCVNLRVNESGEDDLLGRPECSFIASWRTTHVCTDISYSILEWVCQADPCLHVHVGWAKTIYLYVFTVYIRYC